ncbi:MAG: 23S rRNA (uracil(1939)-C(5))-methyltransferase RlmD [Clostridiales bacterium]|nr:23S rRNA (uracil(1939)-C(5))-methyltransferase RlmD [Clostridiales bacterium]
MNVNEVIELEIESNGMNGEGVAHCDGKVVFVPYTLKGERVRAVVKQVKKKYSVCSVIKVLSQSEYRAEPQCPHYYKCGGCDARHITPDYRKEVLIAELKNNLKKIANIDYDNIGFEPYTADAPPRNKLSMPFGLIDGKIVLGLYRQNTHVVEPVSCAMSGELAKSIADIVCEFANRKRLPVYDEKSGRGLLRHLVVRTVGDRASATLVINAQKFDGEKELANAIPDNVDFFVCPNTAHNNVIMGSTVRLVKGNARLSVNVLGVKAELSPLSFFQVNDYMRDKLYTAAMDNVTGDTLIDLYSGIGITSNLAAKKCCKVIAVECVPQAVKDADYTAELNGNAGKITNVCGNVEDVLPRIVGECNGGVDVLIDPPRKGCGEGVARAIAEVKPNTLIYISCNHATMCRDIRAFLDASPDYEITSVKLFDMFVGTHHVETLICLKRKWTK